MDACRLVLRIRFAGGLAARRIDSCSYRERVGRGLGCWLACLVVKRGITVGERGSETSLLLRSRLGVEFELALRDLRVPSHGEAASGEVSGLPNWSTMSCTCLGDLRSPSHLGLLAA